MTLRPKSSCRRASTGPISRPVVPPVPKLLHLGQFTFDARSLQATQAVAQAFARLLTLAENRDSAQNPRIAHILAETYNGEAFKLARKGGGLTLPTDH